MRTPQIAAGKGGKGKGGDDETHTSFHGVVYLNLAPLLYPGVKRIRGAYRVHAYTDAELTEKVCSSARCVASAARMPTLTPSSTLVRCCC